MIGRKWSENETKMAFALYWVLPPKDYKASTSEVIQLAEAIGKTPNAVKMKMENLKRGDSNRQALGQKGLPNGATLELQVWREFDQKGNIYLDECLSLLAEQLSDLARLDGARYALIDLPPEGTERTVTRVERVNQTYFRNNLLENYQGRCCISELGNRNLLIASHIKPWSVSDPKTERLASDNGVLLNALHDRAFDAGLITIDTSYRVVISSQLSDDDEASRWIRSFAGKEIRKPIAMPPAKEFLEYHNDLIFVA